MGVYLNPSNNKYKMAVDSKIYVDKSEILIHLNSLISTEQRYVSVSRPRRFGKMMTANMICAYYGRSEDSQELFADKKIRHHSGWDQYLNHYDVIRVNMIDFLTDSDTVTDMIRYLTEELTEEIMEAYPDVRYSERRSLRNVMNKLYAKEEISFVIVLDEWDAIFREYQEDIEGQKEYLDFLRDWLKDKDYVALAYMTGILPVKKYGKHSALNMFTEISMTNPREYAEYTGFTEAEVRALCEEYQMSYDQESFWYDGYSLKGISIYNPRSVVMSMTGHDYDNYWTQTETYDALKRYIVMDFDGLTETVTKLIEGERIQLDTAAFQNDMTSIQSANDVLTLLIHLGYLTYDFDNECCWIPNHEIMQEFIRSIKDGGWETVVDAIHSSDRMLQAILNQDEKMVAALVEKVHQENTSIIEYNDENSLSAVLTLALFSAKKSYIIHRELASGKGYADLVLIPRRNNSNPGIVIELKWNHEVETAIDQIKKKEYPEKVKEYLEGKNQGMLLVGISYEKETKEHECWIERL